MKFQVTLKTTVYRGTHDAEVTKALDIEADMKVGDLVHKCLKDDQEYIIIRIMKKPNQTDY